MSDIATLMRAANPVPDSDAVLTTEEFDALLLLTQSRSGKVDIQELTKPVEPKKKQRSGWLIAAAAFAVVIVFVGAAMLLANPADELPPATTPPTTQAAPPTTQAATPTTVVEAEESVKETTPTTIAEVEVAVTAEDQLTLDEYVAAFNASDAEAIMGLMLPSAKVRSFTLFDASPERWSDELAWRWAMNEQWAIGGCKTSFGAVACDLTVTGGWASFLGAQDAVLRTIIADGVVSSLSLNEDLAVLVPYAADLMEWVEAEHPEAVSVMVHAGGDPRAPKLTEESIALWVELVPQYEATISE